MKLEFHAENFDEEVTEATPAVDPGVFSRNMEFCAKNFDPRSSEATAAVDPALFSRKMEFRASKSEDPDPLATPPEVRASFLIKKESVAVNVDAAETATPAL